MIRIGKILVMILGLTTKQIPKAEKAMPISTSLLLGECSNRYPDIMLMMPYAKKATPTQ